MKQQPNARGRRFDAQRMLRMRESFYRRKPGAIAVLTRRVISRLAEPRSGGGFLQREVRESVALAPLRALFPKLRRWAENTFRSKVERCLPLYMAVFTDSTVLFDEFAAELRAQERLFLRIRGGRKLIELLIWEMAAAVSSSLYSREIGARAAELSKWLVSQLAPTGAKRLSEWMEFTEAVDRYLAQRHEDGFFGIDFLLGEMA